MADGSAAKRYELQPQMLQSIVTGRAYCLDRSGRSLVPQCFPAHTGHHIRNWRNTMLCSNSRTLSNRHVIYFNVWPLITLSDTFSWPGWTYCVATINQADRDNSSTGRDGVSTVPLSKSTQWLSHHPRSSCPAAGLLCLYHDSCPPQHSPALQTLFLRIFVHRRAVTSTCPYLVIYLLTGWQEITRHLSDDDVNCLEKTPLRRRLRFVK